MQKSCRAVPRDSRQSQHSSRFSIRLTRLCTTWQ